MRPNVKFRVDLPKTNPGLAKSHLQKAHGYACKKPPPIIIIRGVYLDMAKVTYGWTVTTLSYLQVDAWPKSPTGGWSLR